MSRGAWALLLLAACGCSTIETSTRVERGPLLRTFERPQVVEGGLRASATVEWPRARVALSGYDTCRTLVVEEYAEDVVTEKRSSAAGPAVSMGIAATLAGAALLALTPAFSNAPDTSLIDGGGRYGPSTRQYVTGWGVVLVSVGVPALAVGIIASALTGESVDTRKVEQVASQRDQSCNDRSLDGTLDLVGERGRTAQVTTQGGAADLAPDVLGGEVLDEVRLLGRPVELDAASRALLDGFFACGALAQEQVASLESLPSPALVRRIERARTCRAVRGDEMAELLKALEGDLQRRRDGGEQVAGPRPTSWEEAVTGWAPRLRFAAGAPDLGQLDAPEGVAGQPALLEGTVAEGVSANIGVLRLGEREVFLFVPPDPPWDGEFPEGTKVEAVGLVVGRHTLGERTLPLLRAVWLRRAGQAL